MSGKGSVIVLCIYRVEKRTKNVRLRFGDLKQINSRTAKKWQTQTQRRIGTARGRREHKQRYHQINRPEGCYPSLCGTPVEKRRLRDILSIAICLVVRRMGLTSAGITQENLSVGRKYCQRFWRKVECTCGSAGTEHRTAMSARTNTQA